MSTTTERKLEAAKRQLLKNREILQNHINQLNSVLETLETIKETEDFDTTFFVDEVEATSWKFNRHADYSGYEEANILYDIYNQHDEFLKIQGKSKY